MDEYKFISKIFFERNDIMLISTMHSYYAFNTTTESEVIENETK